MTICANIKMHKCLTLFQVSRRNLPSQIEGDERFLNAVQDQKQKSKLKTCLLYIGNVCPRFEFGDSTECSLGMLETHAGTS
jgi:hypothetical protein